MPTCHSNDGPRVAEGADHSPENEKENTTTRGAARSGQVAVLRRGTNLSTGESHPHEALVRGLLDLPRADVRSIVRVVMAAWALRDARSERERIQPRLVGTTP